MPVPVRTRMLARVIFAVALLGVLVVTHLHFQVEKGFEDGCTGFGEAVITAESLTAGPEAGGCGDVATGEYADFLGVSNIVWGLLFYIGLALLRLGYAATGNRSLRLASFGFVGVGFLYTLYLVGLQAFVIGSWCPLCMISAALVTTLFLLHILEHRREATGERHSAPPPTQKATLVPYGAIAGAFAALLAVVVVMGQGDAPEEPPTAIAQAANEEPSASPASLAPPIPQGCTYDPVFPPVADLSAFTNNPSRGTGSVSVVEVFDPNCPACQSLHATLESVKAATQEQATFYSVPFPLRPPANPQAVALAWASETDAYFDLVDEMFARLDNTWGMSQDELRETINSVGLDGPSLLATLQNPDQAMPFVNLVTEDVQAVQQHLTAPGGGLSTPKLLINGRIVANTNTTLTESCLTQLITEAAGVASAGPAAVVEEIQ
ncbi:MAG: vitamin K epoxide reductase family protein [Bacteroidota bacterium]